MMLCLAVLPHESVLVSEPANEGAGNRAASCRIAADATETFASLCAWQ